MGGDHWTAERTNTGWGLRYNPTPGGVKNAGGSTSYSLSFIALLLTDMVGDPERVAHELAKDLNASIREPRP
jgi:hypothetical protein